MRRIANELTAFMLYAMTAIALPAQTFTTLLSFNGTDGADPQGAALIQTIDGDLYGTTSNGGANQQGTIFKIAPDGTLTTLYSFCSQSGCSDGANPFATLLQGADGDFYGTTYEGGAAGYGTVFKITPSDTLTTLYSFCSLSDCTDGANPQSGLVQANNGDLYGTTLQGGANDVCGVGCGTVFKITPSGVLTTLYRFCTQSGCADGEYPHAGLVQTANGDLYGTTAAGGNDYDAGTVFKITPSGTLTTLYSFCAQSGCVDGSDPVAGLILAANGGFYGTTEQGGANDLGTVFKITPSGALTTLHSFCAQSGCPDGAEPLTALVQATNGDLYGTTSDYGIAYKTGTIFEITPGGTLTTLHSFNPSDGYHPGTLMQATNGIFYGTTVYGGANNDGILFSLSVGLGPFVKVQPTFGKVGEVVKILGNDLTGATSVSFNGTPAAITFVSPTEISTTVPSGATTGKVQVTTSGRTLVSNLSFRVFP
jgi:uncharacterized repeat protein (TIGR03803 family)